MAHPSLLSASEPWSLILAAGEGSRLRTLTRDSLGNPVPKQFCRFGGHQCLLEKTWSRAVGIAPRERILAVVAAQHRPFWGNLRGPRARDSWVVQPRNVGTAAGILLPIWKIYREDPAGVVVVLPSDHFVGRELRFRHALRRAVSKVRKAPDLIAILGIRAERPEADYGWIVPSRPSGTPPGPVAAFREKPNRLELLELQTQGALINSFAFAARVETLIALYDRHLPQLSDPFRRALMDAKDFDKAASDLYEGELPSLDFSRHLLQQAVGNLWLVEARDCGWTDLGTPERLLAHMGSEKGDMPRADGSVTFSPAVTFESPQPFAPGL